MSIFRIVLFRFNCSLKMPTEECKTEPFAKLHIWWMMMMFGQRHDPSITLKLRAHAAGQASVAYGYQRQVVTPKPTGQLGWRQQFLDCCCSWPLLAVPPPRCVLRVVYIKKYQCAWLIYELFASAHPWHVRVECMPCGSTTSKVASEALLGLSTCLWPTSLSLYLSPVWLATSDFACDVVTVQCRFNGA